MWLASDYWIYTVENQRWTNQEKFLANEPERKLVNLKTKKKERSDAHRVRLAASYIRNRFTRVGVKCSIVYFNLMDNFNWLTSMLDKRLNKIEKNVKHKMDTATTKNQKKEEEKKHTCTQKQINISQSFQCSPQIECDSFKQTKKKAESNRI